MSEYIRISDYCKASGLNKSKVYRAINTGQIKTKKIDGVMYIDVELLIDEFAIEKTELEAETLEEVSTKPLEPSKTLQQTKPIEPSTEPASQDAKCELVSVEKEISEKGFITLRHYEILQDIYNKLERRTQVALDTQEESLNILKSELETKKQEIVKLNDEKEGQFKKLEDKEKQISELEKKLLTLKNNQFSQTGLGLEIDDDSSDKSRAFNVYEKTLKDMQDKLDKLETIIEEKQRRIEALEDPSKTDYYVAAFGTDDVKKPDATGQGDSLASEVLQEEIESLKARLTANEKTLKEKQNIIDELRGDFKRDDYVTVLKGISSETASTSVDDEDKSFYLHQVNEKQLEIDELKNQLGILTNKILQLENDLLEKEGKVELLEDEMRAREKAYAESQDQQIIKDQNALISENNSRIKDLETELQVSIQRINEMENSLDEKQLKIDELEEEMQSDEAMVQVEKLKQDIRDLEDVVGSKDEKIEAFDALIKEKQKIIYDLEQNLFEKQQRILSFEKSGEHQREIERLETELNIRQSKIRELENELEKLKYDIPSLENVSIDIQQRFSYYQNEIDDQRKRILDLETKLHEKQDIISDNEILIQDRQQRIKDIQDLADKKQKRIDYLEKDLVTKQQKIAELERARHKTDWEEISLDAPSESVELIEKLEKQLQEKQNRILSLEQELNEKSSILETPIISQGDQSLIENLEQELESARNKIVELEKLTVTIEQDAEFSTRLLEKDERIKYLEEELNQKQEMLIKMETSLYSDEPVKKLSEDDRDKEELINDLQNDLKSKIEYIEMLEKTLNEVNKGIDDVQEGESKEKFVPIEQFESELTNKEEIISQLELQINQLQEEILQKNHLELDETSDELENIIIRKDQKIAELETYLDELKVQKLELEQALQANAKPLGVFEDDDSSQRLEEKQHQIQEMEELLKFKDEKISELENIVNFDDSEDAEDYKQQIQELKETLEEKENEIADLLSTGNNNPDDGRIRSLELQIESLIEDNNRKSNRLEELEYAMNSPAGDSATYNLTGGLESEKLRMAADQAKALIGNKEAEIERLRNQLVKLQQDLDQKDEDIKKERQKTISIALSKAKDLNIKPYGDDKIEFEGDSDEKLKDLEIRIHKLESDLNVANQKVSDLEFENSHLRRQTIDTSGGGDDTGKGEWFKKL